MTPSGAWVTRARLRRKNVRESPTRSSPRIRGPVLGEPAQRLDRRQQLHVLGLGARPALLARDELDELVELVDERLRRAAHVARAVGEPQLRPQRLDRARRRRPRAATSSGAVTGDAARAAGRWRARATPGRRRRARRRRLCDPAARRRPRACSSSAALEQVADVGVVGHAASAAVARVDAAEADDAARGAPSQRVATTRPAAPAASAAAADVEVVGAQAEAARNRAAARGRRRAARRRRTRCPLGERGGERSRTASLTSTPLAARTSRSP